MQVVVNNVLLNYQIIGKPQRKTIVILHGWGRNLGDWIPFAKQLTNNAQVVLVDLPGFGGSMSESVYKFSLIDYAKTISDFIQKLKLKNICLIGHSVGGKTAVVIAADYPQLINSLILISPSGFSKRPLLVSLKLFAYKISKPIFVLVPRMIKLMLLSVVASSDYLSAGKLKHTFKKVLNENVVNHAQRIRAKTVIVWAELDSEVPLPSAKYLQSLIPDSIVRIIWKSNHHPHLEKPEALLEIIKQYL